MLKQISTEQSDGNRDFTGKMSRLAAEMTSVICICRRWILNFVSNLESPRDVPFRLESFACEHDTCTSLRWRSTVNKERRSEAAVVPMWMSVEKHKYGTMCLLEWQTTLQLTRITWHSLMSQPLLYIMNEQLPEQSVFPSLSRRPAWVPMLQLIKSLCLTMCLSPGNSVKHTRVCLNVEYDWKEKQRIDVLTSGDKSGMTRTEPSAVSVFNHVFVCTW